MKKLPILVFGAGLMWVLAGISQSLVASEVLTVVYSQAYNGYLRTKLPDGKFKAETYALGEGGYRSGQMRDDSIDRFPFTRLVGVLAPYLSGRNYLPTKSPDGTDLLIVVHWGTTIPFDLGGYQTAVGDLQAASRSSAEGMSMGDTTSALMMLGLQNWLRDKADNYNAALLGYVPEINRIRSIQLYPGRLPFMTYYHDLISDVEEDRYFVILAAFDFQRAWKQKQLKLLWVTRVNVRAHGNRFDEELDAMIRSASRYFGRNSPSLVRQRVPEGKVEVGAPKVIGVVPDAGK